MKIKVQFQRTLLAALLLGATSMAHAVVITFNEYAFDPPPDFANLGSSLGSNGFDFDAEFALMVPAPADFRVASRTHAWQADPGFAAILMTDYPVRVTIARAGGGAFDFNAIDLADSANVGVDRHIRFTFNFEGGGSDSEDVVLDTAPGLQTFLFNRSNLSSVQMRGLESYVGEFPWYQFDNVNATPVPEPASLLLFALGLLSLPGFRAAGRSRVLTCTGSRHLKRTTANEQIAET